MIRVKKSGRVVRTLTLDGTPTGSDRSNSFRYTLPKGGCRSYAYATDPPGNRQASATSDPLRVK